MEVIAFVGGSGTGKSHRALVLAHENKMWNASSMMVF